jgi:hypothetical protein
MVIFPASSSGPLCARANDVDSGRRFLSEPAVGRRESRLIAFEHISKD